MITSKWIMGEHGIEDAHAIRREVFIDEQGVSEQEEFDDLDDRAFHLVIYDHGIPAATGRLFFMGSYHIGRIAVKKEKRGLHLGDLTVRMLLVKAFNDGAPYVTISAQMHAVPFYQHFGFVPYGDTYDEAGIEHIAMKVTREGLILEGDCKKCKKDCPTRKEEYQG